jgi:hypothetical protein
LSDAVLRFDSCFYAARKYLDEIEAKKKLEMNLESVNEGPDSVKGYTL